MSEEESKNMFEEDVRKIIDELKNLYEEILGGKILSQISDVRAFYELSDIIRKTNNINDEEYNNQFLENNNLNEQQFSEDINDDNFNDELLDNNKFDTI